MAELVRIERGGVYLAALNPAKGREVGKLRPVVVVQSDMLNRLEHGTVIVLPLTSQCNPAAAALRVSIAPRDRLLKVSEVLCDQPHAIDMSRLRPTLITRLTHEELRQVEQRMLLVLGFSD